MLINVVVVCCYGLKDEMESDDLKRGELGMAGE